MSEFFVKTWTVAMAVMMAAVESGGVTSNLQALLERPWPTQELVAVSGVQIGQDSIISYKAIPSPDTLAP